MVTAIVVVYVFKFFVLLCAEYCERKNKAG